MTDKKYKELTDTIYNLEHKLYNASIMIITLRRSNEQLLKRIKALKKVFC